MNKTISLFLLSVFIGLCSIGFVVLLLIEPANETKINYSLYKFDYIIPRPWYTQIDKISDLDFVDSIIPFYLYRGNIHGNDQLNFDLVVMDENNSKGSIFAGNLEETFCIIDERFAEKKNLRIGDEISFELLGTIQTRVISNILPSYPFSSRPTAFIKLTDTVELLFINNIDQLSYSGAYVGTNNLQLSDNYFFYEYYPMGKVGEPSWYENREAYEYMLNSITMTTAANEIISVEPLRIHQKQLITDYYRTRISNFILTCILVLFWIILLWTGILIINNRKDEAMLALGCKIQNLCRRYFISFGITGIAASVGSLILGMSYSIKYAIIFECVLLCGITLLCIITHRRFYKKERR